MSLPSPNGSTSSIISSEDSSSTSASTFSARQPSQQQYPLPLQPSTSLQSSFQSGSSTSKQLKLCRVCGDRAKSYHVSNERRNDWLV